MMKVFDRARELIDYTMIITDNTKRFPKKARFTFVDRMQNMTLDIYRKLAKANEMPINVRKEVQIDVLSEINVFLALVEICHKRQYISNATMETWVKKTMDVKYLTAAWMKRT
ncbi:MAG: hypothetical protein PWQ06_113 [Anaerophaga sp.]|nr:hypothetical protein [Anaerophaga sp.]